MPLPGDDPSFVLWVPDLPHKKDDGVGNTATAISGAPDGEIQRKAPQ